MSYANLNDEYQVAVLRTAPLDKYSKKELMMNGILGLCGETGECGDILKKHLFQGHELNRDKLIEELGDVAWYIALTAYSLDTTMAKVLEKNIAKLEERYPNGFESDRSVNRERYSKKTKMIHNKEQTGFDYVCPDCEFGFNIDGSSILGDDVYCPNCGD